MNLKESYRYANYLDSLSDTAYTYLLCPEYITTSIQMHLRRKADSEAENETLTLPKPYDVEFTPMNIIDFVVKIIEEKERLTDAIAAAKASAEINIDNAISMNKKKQAFIHILTNMANTKSNTRTIQGYGYKFNAEGNQTKYYYDIEETTTIDYDRRDIKALAKKYSRSCDEISAKLDAIEINTTVDFTPTWDVNDSFEDAIESAAKAAV